MILPWNNMSKKNKRGFGYTKYTYGVMCVWVIGLCMGIPQLFVQVNIQQNANNMLS